MSDDACIAVCTPENAERYIWLISSRKPEHLTDQHLFTNARLYPQTLSLNLGQAAIENLCTEAFFRRLGPTPDALGGIRERHPPSGPKGADQIGSDSRKTSSARARRPQGQACPGQPRSCSSNTAASVASEPRGGAAAGEARPTAEEGSHDAER